MKRIVSFIIIIALSVSLSSAALAADNMAEAIKDLSSYLSNAESVQIDINTVIDAFGQFGNKDKAVEFKFYAMMVKYISEDNWADALKYADVLEQMEFDKYLESETFVSYMESFGIMNNNYSNIRPVEEVRHYIAGRKAEAEGRMSDAFDEYLKSYSFFDGGDRLNRCMGINSDNTEAEYHRALELYGTGKPEEALRLLVNIKDKSEKAAALYDVIVIEVRETNSDSELAATAANANPLPADTKQPVTIETPVSGNINLSLTAIGVAGHNDLSWNVVSGAVSYTIKRHKTNTSYEDIGIVNGTEYKDTAVSGGYRYYYTVVANLQNGSTVSSNEAIIIADKGKSASGSSKKASNPTTAPAAPAATPSPTPTPAPTWGEWSSWSAAAVSSSSTRQVETRTIYHYKRWHYYNTKHKAWYNHYNQYTGSEYKADSGEWQYKTTTSPLSQAGSVSGHTYYEGYWYLDSSGTEYRYRDLK